MKIAGGLMVGIGFLIIAGTVGATDYYDECRAAADCVAGEAMSELEVAVRMLIGLMVMAIGSIWVAKK